MTCDILYNQRESGAQLSSRLCLCNWKESIIMHSMNPPSRGFPQRCLWNSFNVRLNAVSMPSAWRYSFLAVSKKNVEHFLFLRYSPPGDRCCDFLGFVPEGNVSSSSTLQLPVYKPLVTVAFVAMRAICSFISLYSRTRENGANHEMEWQEPEYRLTDISAAAACKGREAILILVL